MITLEHCAQQVNETKRYLRTKGKPNRMHDLLRDQVVIIEFLLAELRKKETPAPTAGR